jgi:hypothetical protein
LSLRRFAAPSAQQPQLTATSEAFLVEADGGA